MAWQVFFFFLVLLQNPALSDDLETEMNGWQEPIQSPPPNLSYSVYEIVRVETLTVLDTSCASQWSYWLLELLNSLSAAVSCLVSLCCLSSWCSLQSSLQPTQGLALCVSVCLFLIPFQGGLIWLSSVSGFCAQVLPATTWVAWVLRSIWLQDRTWRVTYLRKTRRFCWNSYFKIGEESTACCNVAVWATVCHIPKAIKLFYSAQDLTARLCPQCFGVGLSYLVSLWEQDEALGMFVPMAWLKMLLCRHIPPPALLNVWAHLKPCVCQVDVSALNLVAFAEVPCDRWEQKGPVMPMLGLSMLQIAAGSALHQRPVQSMGTFFSFHAWELHPYKVGIRQEEAELVWPC